MIKATDYAGALAPLPLTEQEIDTLLTSAIREHKERRASEIRVAIPRHSIKAAAAMAEAADWSVQIVQCRSSEPDAPDTLVLRLRLSAEEIGRARAAGYAAPAESFADDRPPVPTSGPDITQFSGLLLALFGADELRRFIRYACGSADAALLPGGGTSPATLAFHAADMCHRHGHAKTVAFWEALEAERPRRKPEIRRVALLFGVST